MVPISEPKDLQDRGTIAALKRRRPGHATATVTIISAWLGVGRHRGGGSGVDAILARGQVGCPPRGGGMGPHGPMVPQGVHFGGATPGRARFYFLAT